MGAFFYGINEPSAWKSFDRKSLFSFFLRSAQANINHIIIYWKKTFYEIRFAIQEPVTSLVRGQAK